MFEEFNSFFASLNVKSNPLKLGKIEGIEFELNTKKVFCTITGVGKAMSSYTLGAISSIIDIEKVINIGTAGSLKESVKPFDVVIANKLSYLDVDLTSFGYRYGQMSNCPPYFKPLITSIKWSYDFNIHYGHIITADSFLTSSSPLMGKIKKFDEPLCIDMEGCSIAQIAFHLNIPFIVIRTISDSLSTNNSKEHELKLEKSMVSLANIFKEVI